MAKGRFKVGFFKAFRVARLCGAKPDLQIIPFRGEYYKLVPEKEYLVRHLVYPVPDPRFPFLGVHFTRMVHGGIEAGPNAVLAFSRNGYSWSNFSPRDLVETLGFHEVGTGGICVVTPGPLTREQRAAALGPLAQSSIWIDVSEGGFHEIFSP